MGSDGNYYVGDTTWHEGILHIKIAFYQDSLTDQTGCLRVIPGSHRPGDSYASALSKQVSKSQELWGMEGAAVAPARLASSPLTPTLK